MFCPYLSTSPLGSIGNHQSANVEMLPTLQKDFFLDRNCSSDVQQGFVIGSLSVLSNSTSSSSVRNCTPISRMPNCRWMFRK
jgi:hypothetical protein